MRILNYEITKLHPFQRPVQSIIKNFLAEENISPSAVGIVNVRIVPHKEGLAIQIECYRPKFLIGKKGYTVRALAGKICRGLNVRAKVNPVIYDYYG